MIALNDPQRTRLFAELFESDTPIHDIVDQYSIPLDDLLDWVESPDIQKRIQRFLALAALRAKTALAATRSAAIATLNRATTVGDIAESTRKAAAQLLRTRAETLDPPDPVPLSDPIPDDTPAPLEVRTNQPDPPTPSASHLAPHTNQFRSDRLANRKSRPRYKKRKAS